MASDFNSKLLLNVPPTRDGLIHETDAGRLAGLRYRLLAMFGADLASGPGRTTADEHSREVDLTPSSRLAFVRLSEDIAQGQSVAAHVVSGFDGNTWVELARGTTVGYARIHSIGSARVFERLRVSVDDYAGPPRAPRIRAYAPA